MLWTKLNVINHALNSLNSRIDEASINEAYVELPLRESQVRSNFKEDRRNYETICIAVLY